MRTIPLTLSFVLLFPLFQFIFSFLISFFGFNFMVEYLGGCVGHNTLRMILKLQEKFHSRGSVFEWAVATCWLLFWGGIRSRRCALPTESLWLSDGNVEMRFKEVGEWLRRATACREETQVRCIDVGCWGRETQGKEVIVEAMAD